MKEHPGPADAIVPSDSEGDGRGLDRKRARKREAKLKQKKRKKSKKGDSSGDSSVSESDESSSAHSDEFFRGAPGESEATSRAQRDALQRRDALPRAPRPASEGGLRSGVRPASAPQERAALTL